MANATNAYAARPIPRDVILFAALTPIFLLIGTSSISYWLITGQVLNIPGALGTVYSIAATLSLMTAVITTMCLSFCVEAKHRPRVDQFHIVGIARVFVVVALAALVTQAYMYGAPRLDPKAPKKLAPTYQTVATYADKAGFDSVALTVGKAPLFYKGGESEKADRTRSRTTLWVTRTEEFPTFAKVSPSELLAAQDKGRTCDDKAVKGIEVKLCVGSSETVFVELG